MTCVSGKNPYQPRFFRFPRRTSRDTLNVRQHLPLPAHMPRWLCLLGQRWSRTTSLMADIYIGAAGGVCLLLALAFFMWWSGCWCGQHRCTVHKRKVTVVRGDGTTFLDGGGLCTGGRSVVCSRPECQDKWMTVKEV
jgi:hypothetical protein